MIGKIITHYKILEKLGEGGMGVVYKAEDTKLKRTVALKFLPPELTRDANAKQRFIHEAQAASALEHNNICNIHEINETRPAPGEPGDDQTFIVMACYEGEILKDKIQHGPLKIDEAIDIAIQISQGLDKAHQKGIVHRDIKPGNILITEDGVVKIIDFGLAKLAGQVKLTKADTTLGTVAYMSPEQAQGEEVDHRTDLWSLGVVLYEMITGQRPFRGEYDQAVLYAIMNDAPEPPTGLRTGLSAELEKVVNKCLEKDRSLRYQHADDLVVDLRRAKRDTDKVTRSKISETQPVVAADAQKMPFKRKFLIGLFSMLGAAILTAAILLLMPRDKAFDSLAILPFVNTTGQADTEWLSDGIPESIIASLQRIPNLRVTSFQSVLRQYEDEVPAVGDVRRDFNVKSVVMGRMTLRGDDITVNIEVVDTRDNSVILAQEYMGNLAELFDVRSNIGRDITEKLSLELTDEVEGKVFPIQRPDHEAYQQYLRGRHFQYKRTPRDLKIALEYFQRAIDIDPEYALAYSGLADTYRLMEQYAGASRYWIMPKARAAAEKALELDNTLAEVHTSMGGVLTDEERYVDAKKAFERAIELNPNYLLAYHWGSINLGYMGNFTEDIALAREALELDPRSPIISSNLSTAYRLYGQSDKAVEEHEKNIERNPDHPSPYLNYGVTLSSLGEHEKAIDMGKRGMAIDSLSLVNNIEMGNIYRHASWYDEAIDLYQRMMDHNPDLTLAAHREMGLIYRHKGDFEKAITHYQKAIDMDPIDVDSYRYLGEFFRIAGEYEKSIAQYKKTIDLEPQLPANHWRYGHALGIIGEHERALEQLQIAAELDPSYHRELGIACFHARAFDKAYENLKKVIQVVPNNAYALFCLSQMYLSQDRFEEGMVYAKQFFDIVEYPNRNKIYDEAFRNGIIDEKSTKNYIKGIVEEFQIEDNPARLPRYKAIGYAFIDNPDSAFVMLNKAFDTQDLYLARLIQSAYFDKLRSDPRYDALVKKLKLEKYIKPLE